MGTLFRRGTTVLRYGRKNTILLNHDISNKVEDEDVKRFKEEVADYLDLPITYANRENFQTDTPLSLCRQLKMIRFGAGSSILQPPRRFPVKDNIPCTNAASPPLSILYSLHALQTYRSPEVRFQSHGYHSDIVWVVCLQEDTRFGIPGTADVCVSSPPGEAHWHQSHISM